MTHPTPEECEAAALSIDSLCEALDRDKSHALVIAVSPAASSARIPALLSQRLADSLEVVIFSLAGLEPDAAVARILGDSGAADALDARLLQRVGQLAQRGSASVLVLPDAQSISAATLRRLGRLAAESQGGLRLVLLVDCIASSVDSTAAALVGDLGAGVAKLVVGLPVDQSLASYSARGRGTSARATHSPSFGPPRVTPPPGRRRVQETAIRVRAPGRPHKGNGVGVAALALVVAGVSAWAWGPSLDFFSAIRAQPAPAAVSAPALASTVVPVLAVTRSAELGPISLELESDLASSVVIPWRSSVGGSEAEPAWESPLLAMPAVRAQVEASTPSFDEASPPPAPVASPAQPTPGMIHTEPPAPVSSPPPPAARRIAVNMNADPWAEVQVDGRELGTTPLAGIPLEVGTHEVVLRFPDGRVVEETLEVDAYRRYFRFP